MINLQQEKSWCTVFYILIFFFKKTSNSSEMLKVHVFKLVYECDGSVWFKKKKSYLGGRNRSRVLSLQVSYWLLSWERRGRILKVIWHWQEITLQHNRTKQLRPKGKKNVTYQWTTKWCFRSVKPIAPLREMALPEFALLGTLIVVGLRVALCLVEETPLLSTFCAGLTWMGSEYRDTGLYC